MSEWDKRELCPDGGCVGILGSDGTCSVCGKRGRAAGAAPAASEAEGDAATKPTDFDEDDEYYYEDEDGDGDEDDEDGDADSDDEGDADAEDEGVARVGWSERKLCPDGGCVGVIGDNGTCKVCGKTAP